MYINVLLWGMYIFIYGVSVWKRVIRSKNSCKTKGLIKLSVESGDRLREVSVSRVFTVMHFSYRKSC